MKCTPFRKKPGGRIKTAPVQRLKDASPEVQALVFGIGNSMTLVEGVAAIKKQIGIDIVWPQSLSKWLCWYARQEAFRESKALVREAVKEFVEKSDGKALWRYMSRTVIGDAASRMDSAMQIDMLKVELEAEKMQQHNELERAKLALRERELTMEQDKLKTAQRRLEKLEGIAVDVTLTPEQKAARLREVFGVSE